MQNTFVYNCSAECGNSQRKVVLGQSAAWVRTNPSPTPRTFVRLAGHHQNVAEHSNPGETVPFLTAPDKTRQRQWQREPCDAVVSAGHSISPSRLKSVPARSSSCAWLDSAGAARSRFTRTLAGGMTHEVTYRQPAVSVTVLSGVEGSSTPPAEYRRRAQTTRASGPCAKPRCSRYAPTLSTSQRQSQRHGAPASRLHHQAISPAARHRRTVSGLRRQGLSPAASVLTPVLLSIFDERPGYEEVQVDQNRNRSSVGYA